MTPATLKFSAGTSTVYRATMLPGGKADVVSLHNDRHYNFYSWKEVTDNIKEGTWTEIEDMPAAKKEKITRQNVMDTPDLVEVGDTIVYFENIGEVELRRKGVVGGIRTTHELGKGRFITSDMYKIDYGTTDSRKISGLYVVDKAPKKVVSAADKPEGTIMSYKASYTDKIFTNIKVKDGWREIFGGELIGSAEGLSNNYIDKCINLKGGTYLFTPGE